MGSSFSISENIEAAWFDTIARICFYYYYYYY